MDADRDTWGRRLWHPEARVPLTAVGPLLAPHQGPRALTSGRPGLQGHPLPTAPGGSGVVPGTRLQQQTSSLKLGHTEALTFSFLISVKNLLNIHHTYRSQCY